MQRPSKIQSISAITPAICGLQGTCHSWRAAFSSYPFKSTLCTLLPPLVIQPHISVHVLHDGQKVRMCQGVDPANSRSTLCCQIPEVAFKFYFAGSSYGQLICSRGRNCLLVDVFTGAKVLPPQLPFGDNTNFYKGMLTAPLASLNSHLLVWAFADGQCLLLDWLTGSDSWSKLQLNNSHIVQIVEFKGQFIAIDSTYRLYTLSLAPQLGLQEIATVWSDNVDECPFTEPLLVVCSGMLLVVDNYLSLTIRGAPVDYEAYRLDMSTEPATCVEVVKLENNALFLGVDARSLPFSCPSPGRWGGRSNGLYCVHPSKPWVLHGLKEPTGPAKIVLRRDPYIKPFWLYPSMFYSDGQ